MGDIAKFFIHSAFFIWDKFINIAMTLFKTSPTAANGSVYSIAKACFDVLSSISIPICEVFFIIAVIKDVISTQPEQQLRKLFLDLLKFGVMVAVLANLWIIMGTIIEVSDNITDAVGVVGEVEISEDFENDLKDAIDKLSEFKTTANFSFSDPLDFIARIGDELKQFFLDVAAWILTLFFMTIIALAILVLNVSAGLTIINCAYQRIIKPLVILPFSTITVAMAAGSGEAERVTTSYLKCFIGLCISGAFMIVCVKLGTALINGGLIDLGSGGSDLESFIFLSVQVAVMPILTAGLVKNVDGMIARFL